MLGSGSEEDALRAWAQQRRLDNVRFHGAVAHDCIPEHLDKADILEDGDAIRLESGWLVEVRAASEKLVAVTAADPLALLTLVWHIGNRHVPAEITADTIYIGYDHVLVDMLQGLGARTDVVERPFRPVRGAYHHDDHGGHSGHHHGHGHG